MRYLTILLLVAVGLVSGGCDRSPPQPLNPQQDRQLQQQLEKARKAEGASQSAPSPRN